MDKATRYTGKERVLVSGNITFTIKQTVTVYSHCCEVEHFEWEKPLLLNLFELLGFQERAKPVNKSCGD